MAKDFLSEEAKAFILGQAAGNPLSSLTRKQSEIVVDSVFDSILETLRRGAQFAWALAQEIDALPT